MATVVYLPGQKSIGEAFGEGVGAGLTNYSKLEMERKENERQMQHIQKIQESIKSAGDRGKALDLVTQVPFKNIEQYNAAIRWIDIMYPVKDTTIKEVSTYDKKTGRKTPRFVESGKLTGLNDPLMVESMFGENTTLTEPDKPDSSEMSNELARNKFYVQSVGNMLNVKKSIGVNGEILFDFEGDTKKEEAYRYALTNKDKYRNLVGGDDLKAAEAALRDAGAFEKRVEEAPAPVEKKEGLIDKGIKAVKGAFSEKKPSAVARPAGVPAGAKYSPSQKAWWWKDAKGNWKSSKGN